LRGLTRIQDLDARLRLALSASGSQPCGRRSWTREGVRLKAGALLVREWQGKLERVMVLDEGFAWNGKTYGSLSQIAKAMTGTSWNFGLRQGAAKGQKLAQQKQSGTVKPRFPSSFGYRRSSTNSTSYSGCLGCAGGRSTGIPPCPMQRPKALTPPAIAFCS